MYPIGIWVIHIFNIFFVQTVLTTYECYHIIVFGVAGVDSSVYCGCYASVCFVSNYLPVIYTGICNGLEIICNCIFDLGLISIIDYCDIVLFEWCGLVEHAVQ